MAQGAVLRAQHHVPGTERLLTGAAQAQSLVFDLEQAEDVQSHRSDDGQVVIDQLHVAISRLCNPQGLFHPKLVQDVTAYKRSVEYEEGKLDTVVLAAKLAGAGYWVRVRKALGGGQDCFRNLRHEFLIIQGREDADGQEFLVEASLREHFRIPHPTPLYETVLNSIPNEFVGSKTMLEHLVNFLCKHMELAFEEQGFTCPPWRRASAMLSKWLPKAHKVSDRVFSGENSPAAGNWGKRPEGLSPSSSMSGDPGCQAMGVSPRALARSINVLRSTAAGLPEGAVTPDTSVESPGLLTGLAAPVRIGFDVH